MTLSESLGVQLAENILKKGAGAILSKAKKDTANEIVREKAIKLKMKQENSVTLKTEILAK